MQYHVCIYFYFSYRIYKKNINNQFLKFFDIQLIYGCHYKDFGTKIQKAFFYESQTLMDACALISMNASHCQGTSPNNTDKS